MGVVLKTSIFENFTRNFVWRINQRLTMLKHLFLVALVLGAVMSEGDDDDKKVTGYLCKARGKPFKCLETHPGEQYCLTNGRVVCGVCVKKYEYCRNKAVESLNPEKHCGADWKSKQCDMEVADTYP